MATLEIHNGLNQIQRLTISRDQTVIFGSSPKCEIVLHGEGIHPFHGRLRWKVNRYKVDASPNAQFLDVNGKRVVSSSFRQGDEILVGNCRIYMIFADEDLPPEDKTRVQAPPFTPATQPASPFRPPAPSAPTSPSRQPPTPLPRQRGSRVVDTFEQFSADDDSLDGLEILPNTPAPGGSQRRQHRRSRSGTPGGKGGIRNFLSQFTLAQTAPGQEKVLRSPLVVGLVITTAILIALGISLYTFISRSTSNRIFLEASGALADGDNRTAILRFDQYLERNANDPERNSKARVSRALAQVRQFTSTTGTSWSNALTAEQEMLETVAQEPAYRDAKIELADLVLRTGEGLADRTRTTASAESLKESESALALFRNVAGEAADSMLSRSRFPSKLQDARAAVRKATLRTQTLSAMDAAIKTRSATNVFKARDTLIRQYADLSNDREVVDRMNQATTLLREAVTYEATPRAAETKARENVLGPRTSLVLRSSETELDSATPSAEPRIFALADGIAYGLGANSGAPAWQVPVGLSAPFPPQKVSGGSTVLVFDARYNELVRLKANSGELVWRLPLNERISAPPLVLGNQVIQPGPGGNVYLINLDRGELEGTLKLGLPLAGSPITDDTGQHLYVMANQDCLFILKREPLSCEGVVYLGHAAGSIPCSPARIDRYLVIAENHKLKESRWRIFSLEDQGARLKPVQEVPVAGWIWSPPAISGSIIWATGDRAGVAAYAIGDYSEKEPFRLVAQVSADNESTGPSFGFARNERDFWLSGGRPGRYDLSIERSALTRGWSLQGAGAALAPPQVVGTTIILTHQLLDRAGTSLWGVDIQSGTVRWQTVLGSPWPLPLAIASPGGSELISLGLDGQKLALSENQLEAGGFLESKLPATTGFKLPPGKQRRIEGDHLSLLYPGANPRQLLTQVSEGSYRPVELPAELAAAPLFWGSDLLIPGHDGRVYLIDPVTGESRAEPYVPNFERSQSPTWLAPVLLNDNAVALTDDSGRLRRLVLEQDPRPRLISSAEVSLGSEVLGDPASTGLAVIVATDDGNVRSLAANDLSPIGAWPTHSKLTAFPETVGSFVFAGTAKGEVMAFSQDGQRLWSSQLTGSASPTTPVIVNDSVWMLTEDGTVYQLALTDGSVLNRRELHLLPGGQLIAANSHLVVPTASGSVALLKMGEVESGGSAETPSKP